MKKKEAKDAVWPRPQQIRFSGRILPLAPALRPATQGDADWLEDEARRAANVLNQATGKTVVSARGKSKAPTFTVTTMDSLPARLGLKAVNKPEGYVLSVQSSGVVLAGSDAAGVFFGAQTLAQLIERDGGLSLPGVTVRDWPRYPMRGVHLYVPGRSRLDFFRRFLDYMSSFKFNQLYIEFGGGMEYEKHPEINEAWRRFCQDAEGYTYEKDPNPETMSHNSWAREYHPSGPCALQQSRYFQKDSPHTELGGGEWLTKEEVREIVAECEKRHIEVVPEVQSLSHCYYLCCAHPEIAERDINDDPWPDTYCPSNPKSYELLFDVMDEIIEVTKPRIMHIGHDEWYTMGVCPKCRERTGADLLADDLNRIHDFLTSRGVRTMLWGDKLMNFVDVNGRPQGGVARETTDPVSGKKSKQLETWQARDRVPKDMLICDWYWSLKPDSERAFHELGFEEIYGNFLGNFKRLAFENWEKRAHVPYVHGAEVSSWCEVSAYAFGHNRVLFAVFVAADLLWNGRQVKNDKLWATMSRRLPPYVDVLTGESRWLASGKAGKADPVNIAGAAGPLPDSLAGKLKTGKQAENLRGAPAFQFLSGPRGVLDKAIVLNQANPESNRIGVDKRAKKLFLLHGSTMEDVYLRPTYYSFHRPPAVLLKYRVKYADGEEVDIESFYGDDIGPLLDAPKYAFRSVPVNAGPGQTLYAQEWTNPRPEAVIESIRVALGPGATEKGDVIVAAISSV